MLKFNEAKSTHVNYTNKKLVISILIEDNQQIISHINEGKSRWQASMENTDEIWATEIQIKANILAPQAWLWNVNI